MRQGTAMQQGTKGHRLNPLMLATGIALIALLGGCEKAQEFRAAATDSLQTGVNAIADGMIAGLFAVFEPDTTSSTTTGAN